MQRLVRIPFVAFGAALIGVSLFSTPTSASTASVAASSGGSPRVVNITSDSAPGWLPSAELDRQARQTAIDFMADMDSGKYAEAYALLADLDRKDQTLQAFSDRLRQFNSLAGAVVERRITTVTWTKDSVSAPLPGIYVALDLVGRFANIDRHCGFLILYQAPSERAFKIMRQEDYFLDNATAASIAQHSSVAEVDKAWASNSAHCPGYTSQGQLAKLSAPSAPIPEASGPTTGYPTVAAALEALHSKADVVFTNQDGWTIANDAAASTLWSFPPPGNPAYPAAVKRQVVQNKDGSVDIQMSVQCEASKKACDDLVRSFEQLNAQIAAGMRGKQ